MQLTLPDWNRGQWLLIVLAGIFIYRVWYIRAYWFDVLLSGVVLFAVGVMFLYLFALMDGAQPRPKLPWLSIGKGIAFLVVIYLSGSFLTMALSSFFYYYQSYINAIRPGILLSVITVSSFLLVVSVKELGKLLKEYEPKA